MILSIIIVFVFCFGINKIKNENKEINIQKNYENLDEKEISKNKEKNIPNSKKKSINKANDEINTNDSSNEFEWYIEIPKIKLYAPIEEGTEEEILNRSVGHFEDTSKKNGNCGLAAHNRGYRVNYFARLKELEKGDIINYFVDEKLYKYKIDEISVIYETDWNVLEDTEESKITLITCIENRDEYRLCIQGSLID